MRKSGWGINAEQNLKIFPPFSVVVMQMACLQHCFSSAVLARSNLKQRARHKSTQCKPKIYISPLKFKIKYNISKERTGVIDPRCFSKDA
jgi:hypothetical protein